MQSLPISTLAPAPPGPNFASLGAAFRPGFIRPNDLFPLPFEIPPAPALSDDVFSDGQSLSARSAAVMKGGKEKKKVEEDEDMSGRWLLGDSSDAEVEDEAKFVGTPMKAAQPSTGWIVPDTPMGQ